MSNPVRQFMLKKFPTNEYMDCPLPQHHWETIQEYADQCTAPLEARIRELEEGWISVEARPPEINKNGDYSERVLVLTSSGLMRVGFMMNNEWFQDHGGKSFNEAGYLVTHWRPLPQPPKQ